MKNIAARMRRALHQIDERPQAREDHVKDEFETTEQFRERQKQST
jgi:hypothetical protein